MKNFITLFIAIFLLQVMNAQTTFTSVQSGNWDNPNTWDQAASYPQANDNVIIEAGHVIELNVDFPPGVSDGIYEFELKAGAALLEDDYQSYGLYIGGEANKDVKFIVEGTIIVKNINILDIYDNAGDELSVGYFASVGTTGSVSVDLGAEGVHDIGFGFISILATTDLVNNGEINISDELYLKDNTSSGGDVIGNGALKFGNVDADSDGFIYEIPATDVPDNNWAAVCTWIGTTDSDWETASNWYDNKVPTAIQAAAISNGITRGSSPIVDDAAGSVAGKLYVSPANSLQIDTKLDVSAKTVVENTGSLDVSAGGELNISGFLANSGAITTGSGSLIDVTGYFPVLTEYPPGSGNYVVIYYGYLGDGDITGEGSTWTIDSAFFSNEGNIVTGVGTDFTTGGSTFFNDGSLEISKNATMEVLNGALFAANNTAITLKSAEGTSDVGGSLIYDDIAGAVGAPTADVEVFLTDGTWHYFSAPTTNATVGVFDFGDNDAWVTEHHEEGGASVEDYWEYIGTVSSSDPLNVGQGYGCWLSDAAPRANKNVVFNGELRHQDYIVNFSYTPGDPDYVGFNLIGNPFSSALHFDDTWQYSHSSQVEKTVWLWNGANYDAFTETATTDIPLGQGFFMKANTSGAKVWLPADGRVHSTQTYYKKGAESGYAETFSITATNNDLNDRVQISFGENGSDDFENGWDASKLFGSNTAPQMYLVEQERKQTYNHLALLNEAEEKVVQLSYVAGADGEQSLIADFSGIVNTKVLLEDLVTGTTHELNTNPVYTFNGSKDDNPDRFLLHFTYSPTGINDIGNNDDVNIYSWNKSVYIRSNEINSGSQISQISIYDIFGRELYQSNETLSGLKQIPMNLNNSYLIVKIISDSKTYTKKVFIQ